MQPIVNDAVTFLFGFALGLMVMARYGGKRKADLELAKADAEHFKAQFESLLGVRDAEQKARAEAKAATVQAVSATPTTTTQTV